MVVENFHPLIVLGAGPAGYTAALYAARAGISVTLVSGPQPGGQLMTTTDVENWPGDHTDLTGPKLMDRMQQHVDALGVPMLEDTIECVTANPDHTFSLKGESGSYRAQAVIVATGASARYLNLPSEKAYRGKGVSACATCDGFFFKDQTVVVVGGGNTAVEEALYLSKLASHVTLVHRRDAFRAEHLLLKKLQQRVQAGLISIKTPYIVKEVLGDSRGVHGVALTHATNTALTEQVTAQGVFIAIGHTPNSGPLSQLGVCDEAGFIQVKGMPGPNATATSIPGLFAAGDIADRCYQQAVTAAASGCMAALDAAAYLSQRGEG